MAEAVQQIVRSMFIPYGNSQLVLPNVAIAEIISFVEPEMAPGTPTWLLGGLIWRDKVVPLVSFDELCGEAWTRSGPRKNRIAICHTLSDNSEVEFIAFVVTGTPSLIQIKRDSIKGEVRSKNESPVILYHVMVGNNTAIIPNLVELENMLKMYITPLRTYAQEALERKKKPELKPLDLGDVDEEIVEIFIEEAQENMALIQEYYPKWRETGDEEALTMFRRSFHTIKGSGRMVNVDFISELAWSVENMLNRLIDNSIQVTPALYSVMDDVLSVLPTLIQFFVDRYYPDIDVQALRDRADALSRGEEIEATSVFDQSVETSKAQLQPQSTADIDEDLLEVFLEEGQELIDNIETAFQSWKQSPNDEAIIAGLHRSLHTLKGSARLTGLTVMGDISHALESLLNAVGDKKIAVSEEVVTVANTTVDHLSVMLEKIKQNNIPDSDYGLVAEIEALLSPPDDAEEQEIDPELVEIFLEEGQDLIESIEQTFQEWKQQPNDHQLISSLHRSLHTLKGGSRLAGIKVIGDVSHMFESMLTAVSEGRLKVDDEVITMANTTIDSLVSMLDQVKGGNIPDSDYGLTTEIEAILFAPTEQSEDDVDPDLLEVFLGEAQELVNQIDHIFQDWKVKPEEPNIIAELYRALHTLKGGARLAGLTAIANLSHSIESVLTSISEHRLTVSDDITRVTELTVDNLASMVELTQQGEVPDIDQDLLAQIEQILERSTAPEDKIDKDLLSVFVDEGQELMDAIETTFQKWNDNPNDVEVIASLKRSLHTLKGGARLSGLDIMGELSHALESLLGAVEEHRLQASDSIIQLANMAVDGLASMLEILQQGDIPSSDNGLLIEIEAVLPKAAFESDEEVDPELVAIFLQEAHDLVDNVDANFQTWKTDSYNNELIADLHRALHTLKGGARLAGLTVIGNLTHAIESVFTAVGERQLAVSEHITEVVSAAIDHLATMLELVEKNIIPTSDQGWIEKIEAILENVATTSVGNSVDDISDTLLAGDGDTELTVADDQVVDAGDEEDDVDELLQVFLEEGQDLFDGIDTSFKEWLSNPTDPNIIADLHRFLHTLKGNARLSSFIVMSDVAHALESLFIALGEHQLQISEDILDIASQTLDHLTYMFHQVKQGEIPQSDNDLVAKIEDLFNVVAVDEEEIDEDLLEIFLEEGQELLDAIELSFQDWMEQPTDAGIIADLHRSLHTLKGSSRLAGLKVIGNLSHALESMFTSIGENKMPATDAIMKLANQGVDQLVAMLEQIEGVSTIPDSDQGLAERIKYLVSHPDKVDSLVDVKHEQAVIDNNSPTVEVMPDATMKVSEDTRDTKVMPDVAREVVEHIEESPLESEVIPNTMLETMAGNETLALEVTDETAMVSDSTVGTNDVQTESTVDETVEQTTTEMTSLRELDDFDEDLLDIFLSEADELIESIELTIQDFRVDRGNTELLTSLQRSLHTLKGGARMASIMSIGDLSHALESLLVAVVNHKLEASDEVIELTERIVDELVNMLEIVSQQQLLPFAADNLVEEVKTMLGGELTA